MLHSTHPGAEPSAPSPATPAPMVIYFARALPVPELFAPALAAHIAAGGSLLFYGWDADGAEHDFHPDEWLVLLDAEMHALGLPGWAASVPGDYSRGWANDGGTGWTNRETVAALLDGSALMVTRGDCSPLPIFGDRTGHRSHVVLTARAISAEDTFGDGQQEIHVPLRELRMGFRLADMPAFEPDQEDAAFAEALEAEAVLLKSIGAPL